MGQSRIKVNRYKLANLAREEFNGEYESLRPFVASAVEMAKRLGIGAIVPMDDTQAWYNMCEKHNIFDQLPEGCSTGQGIDAAQYLLNISNQVRDVIDYDDMIYLTLLRNLRIKKYDYVFVDEAQDTNATRRELVRRMLKPTGRLVAVGDARQAIYGFTGADHDSLNRIRDEFNAQTLRLSVTFRCPKNVVNLAHTWVDETTFQAHESAPDGVVDSCELSEVAKLASQNDAILCRNTKPLVELAYSLLRQSVACRVEGRSIGEGLITLATKWKRVKTVGDLQVKLEEWSQREMDKNTKKGNTDRCQHVEDQVATLEVFISQCEDFDPISVLVERISALFGDTEDGKQEVLTLSTIHRSKGREWDRVFCLGMDTYSPSKWARQEWELTQEDNLCYVQVTRAKKHLTMVTVPPKQRD